MVSCAAKPQRGHVSTDSSVMAFISTDHGCVLNRERNTAPSRAHNRWRKSVKSGAQVWVSHQDDANEHRFVQNHLLAMHERAHANDPEQQGAN